MSELISKDAALNCFTDWIDRYGNEHTADEDAVYQRIAELPAVQPDHVADISKKVERTDETAQNVSDSDLVSRKAAIDDLHGKDPSQIWDTADIEVWINELPSAQPDRAIIDDCLRHIYKNISVHTATGGVIAIKHYMQVLYEEIYGEGEKPWWMK